MENSFFKTKAGKMTLAFIVIMIAFSCIMLGVSQASNSLVWAGFIFMLAAMLYSPIDTFILKSFNKK